MIKGEILASCIQPKDEIYTSCIQPKVPARYHDFKVRELPKLEGQKIKSKENEIAKAEITSTMQLNSND